MTEIDITTDIDFRVCCSKCGHKLGYDITAFGHSRVDVDVEPCDKCMDEADREGYDRGKEDGEEGGAAR